MIAHDSHSLCLQETKQIHWHALTSGSESHVWSRGHMLYNSYKKYKHSLHLQVSPFVSHSLARLRDLITGNLRSSKLSLDMSVLLNVNKHNKTRQSINDPSAGSPTETLLRLLLPLDVQVWSSF